MPDMTGLELFTLGGKVYAAASAMIDPGYLPPLFEAKAAGFLDSGETDAQKLAAKLLEATPGRFRLDPSTVAARERAALRRDVDENVYDSIRGRMKAQQEETAAAKSPAERLGQTGISGGGL